MNDGDSIHYICDFQESRDVSTRKGPCILVASGGMCEAGRILNHLENNIDDPRNSVVLVSYQAPGSLGRKLLERGPAVHFRGRRWNKWADIVDVNGFSGHADQQELGELGGEVDQPASYGGGIGGNQPDTQGEGFILQQGTGSDDLQQDKGPSSAKATEGIDFAAQGRGAPEDEDEASSEGGVG